MRRLLRLVAVLLPLTLAFPAICQDSPAPTAPSPPPVLGLTVSGGVSLGAFEAGYLYYLFETLKLNPGLADPRIFTGASAGSANALLSLLASCSPKEPRPDQSLFYRTWIPVGLKQLYDPDAVTARALFTQNALRGALNTVQKVWDQGLDTSCDAALGLSTTRVTAAKIELVKDRVTLARTEAKFVVRVRGQGAGKAPLMSNYVGPRELLQRPLLPVEANGSISFDSLKQVLLASGAFPLAFEPVPVAHCTATADGDTVPSCVPEHAEIRLFVDGGVFDNQPLRLAVQLAQQGLIGEGNVRGFAALPSLQRNKLRKDLVFVYVDPAVAVLPTVDLSEGPVDDATVPYALYLFEQLVQSSRSKELQVLLEDDPDVTKQITATHAYYMPLSDSLFSFFGFFERDFRVHDFYLGMHSAHRWFAEVVDSWRVDADPEYPEDSYGGSDAAPVKAWAPYRCMRAAFDGVGPLESCNRVSLSLRAGIQTSLDRIYARCAEVAHEAHSEGKNVPATAHNHCRRAFLGGRPPLLPGMKEDRGFEFKKHESPMEHELRRLAAHGFHFRDMGIPRERSGEAKRYVAQRVGALVRALANQQKRGVYRVIFPMAGRLLSQAMAYVPPYATWHVMMGRGLEAGYSGALWDSQIKWLRGAIALELDGLLSLVSTGSSDALKLTPMLGAEFELLPLSSWQYQTRLGLRGGFGFSTRDNFLTQKCKDGVLCSRARGEAYVALVAYQLLRLQLGFAVYPPMRGLGWDYSIQPRIGVELDRP